MRKIGGWLVSAATALGVFTLLGKYIERWLQKNGLLDPDNAISVTTNALGTLTQNLWFYAGLSAIMLATVVYWTVIFWERYSHYRSLQLQGLGKDMLAMARIIAHRQGGFRSEWPENVGDRRAEMEVILSRASKYRIYAPGRTDLDRKDTCKIIHEYFDFVGSFLAHGETKVARARALETKAKLQA